MAPVEIQVAAALEAMRGAWRRVSLALLVASVAGNLILGGVVFLRVKQSAAMAAEISKADDARRAAVADAERAREEARGARQEAYSAISKAGKEAAAVSNAEGKYQVRMGIEAALEEYRSAGGDLAFYAWTAPGGALALGISPPGASEALKRAQLYPGLRGALSEAMRAVWTVSNAMEASSEEAKAERRAREAAEAGAALWKKSAGSAQTTARLQGASVIALAALGAFAGGSIGKSPEWAVAGLLAGAGGGIGVAFAIGRAGSGTNSTRAPSAKTILYLIR